MNHLKGPVYSIVTPFKQNKEIDFKKLFSYLDKAYESGARQFFSMAFNTRYPQLRHEEILAINISIIKHLKSKFDDTTVIVGDPVMCPSEESRRFARLYSDLGVDFVSILFSERFYSNQQVIDHFEYICDDLGTNVLIHEMPLQSGLGGPDLMWPLDLIDKLLDINEICAIKEDAKDDKYTNALSEIVKERGSIVLSGGGKRRWLNIGEKACQSYLNGLGVAYPEYSNFFWETYHKGEIIEAKNIANLIEPLFFDTCVSKFGWHVSIRAALFRRGFCELVERFPMTCLDKSNLEYVMLQLEKVELKMKENGIILK